MLACKPANEAAKARHVQGRSQHASLRCAGVVLFGGDNAVNEGDIVKRTGNVVDVRSASVRREEQERRLQQLADKEAALQASAAELADQRARLAADTAALDGQQRELQVV